jgi:hypothetical protein
MTKLMTFLFLMTFSVGVMAQAAPEGEDLGADSENPICDDRVSDATIETAPATTEAAAASGGASQEDAPTPE